MARSKEQFQTIRTQGAILPADILQRINSLELDGLKPEDYHLPPSIKLNEAISQSWSRVLAFWKSLSEERGKLLDSDETGALITRERWLLPLFQELGYGRLTAEKAPEIDGKLYPIERFWKAVPIHLVGCKLSIDRRAKGVRGAATASPHSLVQEFLNRSDDHLWAFISNGLQLRILRDNLALSRQSYIEFDLEAMMDGEVYADFAMLWILCHQSRLEADKPEECWLEAWSKVAQEQGTRILSDLRDGVTRSIEALGTGFISHRKNDHLRRKLESGQLNTQDYYRQLLRIVYRMLFLFVSEDRELLHPPEASEEACGLYDANYSTRYLRDLAAKMRGSKHADLWYVFSLVTASLAKPEGCAELGLPGLGSFLWAGSSTPDLLGPAQSDGDAPVLIRNDDLLTAIRSLGFVERDRTLRIVDYRNLGSEELGSVYESLLELIPDINLQAKTFSLRTAAGNERKTTGSYYTPDSLVQCLLDSALEPVIEDRLKDAATKAKAEGRSVQGAQEEAILKITVCDPAVGSGHFLIAAAHRLARQLARVRTGDTEPVPEDHQHALRDVIRRCVYGVDINPMAAELCKVALWMESLEPGKALTFLDSHIKVGNSLLGTTPELLAEPLPYDAFKPIEGDDKAKANEFKKRHKQEIKDDKKQQHYIFEDSPFLNLADMASDVIKLEATPQENADQVRAVAEKYAHLLGDGGPARFLADAWCAAFVWPKKSATSDAITHRTLAEIRRSGENGLVPWMRDEVKRLASQYGFFNWHLAFPQVFGVEGTEGFGCIIGNPPWDQLLFREQEFFSSRAPEIADATTSAHRAAMIATLRQNDDPLYAEYVSASREAEGTRHLAHNMGRYPLTGRGRSNTYALFFELARALAAARGRVGMVVPSGLATDDTTKLLFGSLIDSQNLVSLYDFENREGLFPSVDSRARFSLVTATGADGVSSIASFVFYAHRVADLSDTARHFTLAAADLALLNPNTKTACTFRSRTDAILTTHVHRRLPILLRESEGEAGNLWGLTTRPGLFNMSGDSAQFVAVADVEEVLATTSGHAAHANGEELVPLYEGKMVHFYDHRAAGVRLSETARLRQGQSDPFSDSDHSDPQRFPMPRYWISRSAVEAKLGPEWDEPWILGWKEVTAPTNERTLIPCLLPRVGIGHKIPIALPERSCRDNAIVLCACLSSFACDYVVRQKLGTTSLTPFTVKQLPIVPPEAASGPAPWSPATTLSNWVLPRVLELTYTAYDMQAFAYRFGYDGPPFAWDAERRLRVQAELDAAMFHVYLGSPDSDASKTVAEACGSLRAAVAYIMETFPIVRRHDEQRHDGVYKTKETILAIFDEMAAAIASGEPWVTTLNPPPGPPSDSDGRFIPIAKWDESDWPHHIHLVRRHSSQPEAERIERGRQIAYVLALLDAWQKPVSKPLLERGLVLMLNDAARRTILEKSVTVAQSDSLGGVGEFVRGITGLYDYLVSAGLASPAGQTGLVITSNGSSKLGGMPQDDQDRAAEVIAAAQRLGDEERFIAAVGEVANERYELVSS